MGPVKRTFGRLIAMALAAVPSLVQADPTAVTPSRFEVLLSQFASMPGLSARFEEEKHLALLEEPLVSSGELHFAPPDRLVLRVHKPAASTLLIVGNSLTLASSKGQRHIDLESNRQASAFVDTFRLLLSGDAERLRELYRVDFEPESLVWRMRLLPRGSPLREALDAIEVSGRGATVSEIHILRARDDKTVMRFHSVDNARHFTRDELVDLFRIAP
jgi:hypothetical protein